MEARNPGPKSPWWSAERRASRVMGRRHPRWGARHAALLRAHRVPLHPGACRRSAHPSLGWRNSQTPGADAPRECDVLCAGLFDIVRREGGQPSGSAMRTHPRGELARVDAGSGDGSRFALPEAGGHFVGTKPTGKNAAITECCVGRYELGAARRSENGAHLRAMARDVSVRMVLKSGGLDHSP
jgi:hypothetical protein